MLNGFKMFLLAAEELSFSRAAERAFVTQQCLSDHIKRLEKTYQVTLFQRRPRLKLTAEGDAMLGYLSRMQALEDNMINELSDISAGVRGVINIGISSTRGYIIIPQLLPKFQEQFPNVDVQVHLNDTRSLEPLLLSGKLDLLLGVEAGSHVLFRRKYIDKEPIYLVISDQLLRAHFGEDYEKYLYEGAKGLDIRLLEAVPFVQGHKFSTTTHAISQFLMDHSIDLHIPILVSNFDILLELCRTGQYATLSPKFHIRQVMRMNALLPPDGQMRIFPIKGLDKKLPIELITHRDAEHPTYTKVFMENLLELMAKEEQEIQDYLEARLRRN